jgi:hypothetical protein
VAIALVFPGAIWDKAPPAARDGPNRMKPLRYFLLAVIAGAAVLAVLIHRGGEAQSPACDQADVRATLEEIVADLAQGRVPAVEEVRETGYDEARDLRSCAAVAKFADGAQTKVSYTTEWENRDSGKFTVLLQPYEQQDP